MRNYFKKINLTPKQALHLFFILLAIVFTAQNIESVKVRFLFFGFEMPLFVLIFSCFFFGFLATRMFFKNKSVQRNELVKKENELAR